jgi:ferredoxin
VADKAERYPQNQVGKFYVDKNCIACDACVVEAPLFFMMNDKDGHAFVVKQPSSKVEIDNCYEALNHCPVDAIGDDG